MPIFYGKKSSRYEIKYKNEHTYLMWGYTLCTSTMSSYNVMYVCGERGVHIHLYIYGKFGEGTLYIIMCTIIHVHMCAIIILLW